MTAFNEFWQRFDSRARIGLCAGALLIVGATAAAGMALLRTDYQVLFADLAPQDAATMTAELDKMKTPYRLAGDGNTIMVPADLVHKTRLKLVGKELPLRGAAGLELFNASEVGMTEFTQKVNYQRALQGELTRTILALDEVQSVRVHLVMAEQALFRKQTRQAKASIALALKPGRALDPSQVQGIQRLVGAAVPDIRPADVTITDQRGVALTRQVAAGDEAAPGGDGLDDKRTMETYLSRKVMEVLERTFGAGQGIASVDVTLNRDHSKVTTESVLGNRADGAGANGVMVRERLTTRETGAQDDAVKPANPAPQGAVSRETDYQVGRRVEQVVSGAGAVSRINVAVVLRGVRDQDQLARVKDLVALAAGVNKARGDAVSVYSMDQVQGLQQEPAAPAALPALANGAAPAGTAEGSAATGVTLAGAVPGAGGNAALAALILAAVAGLVLLAALWKRGAARGQGQLSIEERHAVLLQVNDWLERPAAQAREHG